MSLALTHHEALTVKALGSGTSAFYGILASWGQF